MYGSTPQSTLVVMPPKDDWGPFVEIKKHHMNPRIKRPPYPHITMMQPFVEPHAFGEVAEILTKALAEVDPFECTLKDFKIFDNGKSHTLFIDPVCDPPGSLERVYGILEATLPAYALKKGFCAHIGIGFFRNLAKAKECLETYQASWTPIRFRVTHLDINYRESATTPFSSRMRIPLRSSPVGSS